MNPELTRNLWLEISATRLVIMIGVLAVVAGLAYVAGGTNWPDAVQGVGAVGFFALAVVWGCFKVGRSVSDEIKDRTWDFQRMSGLSPAAMTLGKLFGAASYVWVGALLCLVAFAFGALQENPPERVAFELARLVLAALFAQGMAMAASLAGARRRRGSGRFDTALFLVAGLGAWWLAEALVGAHRIAGVWTGEEGLPPEMAAIDWHGFAWAPEPFILASLAGFAALSALTCWRLMRAELQAAPSPIWYALGLALIAGWTAGFFDGPGERLLAFGVLVALGAWGTLVIEPKEIVQLRALFAAFSSGRLGLAAALWPAALTGIVLALATSLAALLAPFADPMERTIPLAFAAFLIRDAAVFAFFHFGAGQRRGDFAALVTIALLYAVGPILFGAVDFDLGVAFFLPLADDDGAWRPIVSTTSALAQAAVFAALAGLRWQARVRDLAGQGAAGTGAAGSV